MRVKNLIKKLLEYNMYSHIVFPNHVNDRTWLELEDHHIIEGTGIIILDPTKEKDKLCTDDHS